MKVLLSKALQSSIGSSILKIVMQGISVRRKKFLVYEQIHLLQIGRSGKSASDLQSLCASVMSVENNIYATVNGRVWIGCLMLLYKRKKQCKN